MDPTRTFLLRSDDGGLYRVTGDQLSAFAVPKSDPAYQTAPSFLEAKKLACSEAPDFLCVLYARTPTHKKK